MTSPLKAVSLSALKGIRHGFFTRQGGVSGGLYASLNCGLGSRDTAECVLENRARVAQRLGAEADHLASLYQIHSASAVTVTRPWRTDQAPEADAMVTDVPGLAVGVLTADCAPVLLADAEGGVVAAAHAGWRGALAGILDETIAKMEALGGRRDRIVAAIGPTISLQAYEVDREFMDRFIAADAANSVYFAQPGDNSSRRFDLPRFVSDRLSNIGVLHVETFDSCTYARQTSFFSYRRTVHRGEDDYGRQISAIVRA